MFGIIVTVFRGGVFGIIVTVFPSPQHEVSLCRREQPFVIRAQNRVQSIDSNPESPPAPMEMDSSQSSDRVPAEPLASTSAAPEDSSVDSQVPKTGNNSKNNDLYSTLAIPNYSWGTTYKKIQSKQQSTQNQKTHSHSKTSLERYTYESFSTEACMPPNTSNISTYERTHTHTHTHTRRERRSVWPSP